MRDRGGGGEQQQSICLAREQTIQVDGNQYQNRNSNHQQSGDLSDARESSPEQVDVQLGRQLTRERTAIPPPNRTLPNIELLKSSVRAFLAEYSSPRLQLNWDWDWDWELLDLLTQSIELICGQADTGNLWSEAAVVGADMTVSKVSEERETESVEVYPEQLDQPSELDDKNNNSGHIEASPLATNDMKYELKSARSSSRSPQTESPVSRLSSSATSRIRNVEASVPTTTTTATTTRAPLLGEIKRSSISSRDSIFSSIDADSVLPERTRLRRQRRVRSQDSVEEKPEDVIERLNKLKARISGALSEVKGVLKQYSTESEAESATEQSQVASDGGAGDPPPVSFRFVKKVRRRSYFDEAEEEKEQAGEEQEHENQTNKTDSSREDKNEQDALKTSKDTKVQREQTPFAREKLEVTESQKNEVNEKQAGNESQKPIINEKLEPTEVNKKLEVTENQDLKSTKNQDTKVLEDRDKVDGAKLVKEQDITSKQSKNLKIPENAVEADKQDEKIKNRAIKTHTKEHKDIKTEEAASETPKINGELPNTAEQIKHPAKNKTQAKIEFLAKVQSEFKSKSVKEKTLQEESSKEATIREETEKDTSTRKEINKETTLWNETIKETSQENTSNETSSKESTSKEATPKEATPKETTPKETTLKEASPKETALKEATLMKIASKEETPKESTTKAPTEVAPSKHASESKQSVSLPDESPESTQPPSKIKKKVIVKVKNPRRASIAAVEPSKIKVEPAVEQSDALITQRRPSDSEAIVKRKKKLKLMGRGTDTAATLVCTAESESPRATSSTTKAVDDHQRETTSIAEEQLATPEVTAVPAKLPSAKSGQGEAIAIVAATAAAAEAGTLAATTAIDSDTAINNLAPAGDRIRRTSLKLAELVGETVLVVPAAAAAASAAVATPGPKESKEAIKQVAIAADIVPQIAAVAAIAATATLNHEESSSSLTSEQQPTPVEATKAGEQAPPGDSLASMPELKVLAGPVQPVKIETVEQQQHDVAKNPEPLVKKKAPVHLKKLVRKNSIDKDPQEKQKQDKQDSSKLSNILRDRNKINELSSRINKLTPPKKQAKPDKEAEKKAAAADPKPEEGVAAPLEEVPTENQADQEVSEEPEVEPTPEPKKPRKIKKKVIIKRQKRRLSIGDTFFLQPEPEEPTIPEVETIERAIAYVTDDEEDTVAPEQEPEPIKAPLKSCLHVREYKIGDLVLYAERYRKTQVRWKRGRVLERITSISYKLEIEGKEVPAHVSYIKKYTGRKVRFGGKEYLEIDYEQVAEEERRAASYSIWNMV
ncbi:titin homolog [Drosophila elegans]|uniref:titin homolog n=1 Tax=Drosophila elegans TaxID=30023 RepID=UPI0007E829B1|nr:titin homolog [Drosophila elegans]